MRALVYEGAWQMPLRDVPEPVPGKGEVVIAVHSVGICGSDVHGFKGTTGRRKPPMIMGHEFSGRVHAMGEGVEDLHIGQRVTATPLLTCGHCANCLAGMPNICQNRIGLGVTLNGAYADYVKVTRKMVFPIPDEMNWQQGALVEPLAVGMRAVNLTSFPLDATVFIIGAGTIGLMAIAAARLRGAGRILVADLSDHRLEMARKFGADVIIHSGRKDALDVVKACTGGAGADAVIEAVGVSSTARLSLFAARNGGFVTWIGNSEPEVTINMQQIVTRELRLQGSYGFNQEFEQSIGMIQSGRVDPTGLVEKVASLEEGPQLVRDLAEGKSEFMKVILTV